MKQTIRTAILTEAPGSAARLAAALAGDDRLDIVRVSGGDTHPTRSLLACDVVVLSKAMPSGAILGILGAFWEADRAPKILFLEPPPSPGSGLDDEAVRQLGRRIRRLAAATRRSASTASVYRPSEAAALSKASTPEEDSGFPEPSVLARPLL